MFTEKFYTFALAFMKKYNEKNKFSTCTICQVSTIDENRFGFVWRYENTLTSAPLYEQVIYDRANKTIEARMLDDKYDHVAEKCVYKADKAGGILYEVFLYKNPGWKSFMRKKCFAWGIEKMNELMDKE